MALKSIKTCGWVVVWRGGCCRDQCLLGWGLLLSCPAVFESAIAEGSEDVERWFQGPEMPRQRRSIDQTFLCVGYLMFDGFVW